MRKSPFSPPYPLSSHSLDCCASLKLFPVFWTALLSEEPWPAGLVGIRTSVKGELGKHEHYRSPRCSSSSSVTNIMNRICSWRNGNAWIFMLANDTSETSPSWQWLIGKHMAELGGSCVRVGCADSQPANLQRDGGEKCCWFLVDDNMVIFDLTQSEGKQALCEMVFGWRQTVTKYNSKTKAFVSCSSMLFVLAGYGCSL